MREYFHQPVLLKEVIELLDLKPGDNVIDGTVGGGGHAYAILEKTGPKGKLIGFDKDDAAIAAASKNLEKFKNRVILKNDSYANINSYFQSKEIKARISGVILDLGVSSFQLSPENEAGMSFLGENDLDMRFGKSGKITASNILNTASEEELKRIFKEYGEERKAGEIAKKIIERRKIKPFAKTSDLLELFGSTLRKCRIHPATKIFQALRIAVNGELGVLQDGLEKLFKILSSGGRMAVISYHSLEDRIVKRFFKERTRSCVCPKSFPECRCGYKQDVVIITKKPVMVSYIELQKNPRSRSARLRVIRKK